MFSTFNNRSYFFRRVSQSSDRDRPSARDLAPGAMAVRVDAFMLAQARDANGRAILDEDGQPRQTARGFWGTSVCSGRTVLVRLSTPEEEAGDSGGRPVATQRRSLDDIRLVSGAHGYDDPSLLGEEERPVWLLERARPLLDEHGRILAAVRRDADNALCTQLRCGWITPYPNYTDREGNEVIAARHMEAARFSTVNVSLPPRDEGDYFGLYVKTMQAAQKERGVSFFKACARAAQTITQTWLEDVCVNPGRRPGSFSVTTWLPEQHVRLSREDSDDQREEKLTQLAAFFADPRCTGETRNRAMAPEILLRFLNSDGELCGMWRVRPWELAAPARETGDNREAWGMTDFLVREYVMGLRDDYVAAHGITQVDILPGHCCRVSSSLTQEAAEGRRSALTQLRDLLYMGFSQSRSPQSGMRQNIGCCQAFVPRTGLDYVTGWRQLRDGQSLRSAALLMPGDQRLTVAETYRELVEQEQRVLTSLDCLPQEARHWTRTDKRESHDQDMNAQTDGADKGIDGRNHPRTSSGACSAEKSTFEKFGSETATAAIESELVKAEAYPADADCWPC